MMKEPLMLLKGFLLLQLIHISETSLTGPCSGRLQFELSSQPLLIASNADDAKYPADKSCEWLLTGPSGTRILLEFERYATECSYDFLFLHDGESQNSKLLAALSGDTLPLPFVSSSNKLLLHLYSDQNYVLAGFKAIASLVNESEYPESSCPTDCHAAASQGRCVPGVGCVCASGYTGTDCNMSATADTSALVQLANWTHPILHTAAWAQDPGVAMLFGGFDLNTASAKTLFWNVSSGRVSQLLCGTHPPARYGHVMWKNGNRTYVYGGTLNGTSGNFVTFDPRNVGDDMWVMESGGCWTEVARSTSPVWPLALSGHTATAVEHKVFIIGGRSVYPTFNPSIYVYDMQTQLWSTPRVEGSAHATVSYHAAVFHAASNKILIVGGFRPTWAGFAWRRAEIYTLSPTTMRLEMLPASSGATLPPLGFHSATLLGNDIAVFGGYQHDHWNDETCYSTTLLTYSIMNHSWTKLDTSSQVHGGRFGHTALAWNNMLLAIGGFAGRPLLSAVHIPIKSSTDAFEPDCLHTSCSGCIAAKGCGWCNSKSSCLPLTLNSTCSEDWRSEPHTCALPAANRVGGVTRVVWARQQNKQLFGTMEDHNLQPSMTDLRPSSALVSRREMYLATVTVPASSSYLFTRMSTGGGFIAVYSEDQSWPTAMSASSNSGQTALIFAPVTVGASSAGPINLQAGMSYKLVSFAVFTSSQARHTVQLMSTTENSTAVDIDSANTSPVSLDCSELDSCLECSASTTCAWCGTSCRERGASPNCSGTEATDSTGCTACSDLVDCRECLTSTTALCNWQNNRCTDLADDVTPINVTTCPAPCMSHSTCDACLSETDEYASNVCSWCPSSNSCLDWSIMTSAYVFGQCKGWYRGTEGNEGCPDCSIATTCNTCLETDGCGWCHDPRNGTVGICVFGSDMGPQETCPVFPLPPPTTTSTPAVETNLTTTAPTQATNSTTAPMNITTTVTPSTEAPMQGVYTYLTCPDVDECAFIPSVCARNATCINTNSSYECQCDAGYQPAFDDYTVGRPSNPCLPVCTQGCVNGECVRPDVCECELGWEGANCTLDCGCNLNGDCSLKKPNGDCVCSKNTTGSKCTICAEGYFGDPLTGTCEPCDCSGHGDTAFGVCDRQTGKCFCRDYTYGFNCEVCLSGYYRRGDSCYKGCDFGDIPDGIKGWTSRAELTEPFGGFGTNTDKFGSYVSESTCSWAIRGSESSVIQVDFEFYATECTYDYIHVFDGPSPFQNGTNVLASIAGTDELRTVVSLSGYMLVMFYSDSNYELRGFEATYSIHACPSDCSDHGTCQNDGTCACDAGWRGDDCAEVACPDNCMVSQSHGFCNTNGVCLCFDPYVGSNCNETSVTMQFDPVPIFSPSTLPARSGHTVVHHPLNNKDVIFGGFDLNVYMNDVWTFYEPDGKWFKPTTSGATPAGRHLHCAVVRPLLQPLMVTFGGALSQTVFSDEVWTLDLSTFHWKARAVTGTGPEAVAGHACVRVANIMYVYGGAREHRRFSSLLYALNLDTWTWTLQATSEAKPSGLFGATLDYDVARNQLVLFGGQIAQRTTSGRTFTFFTVRSSALSMLDLTTFKWTAAKRSALFCSGDDNCLARSAHAAYVVDDYLIVFGGSPFDHSDETNCYTNTFLLYHLECNEWLSYPHEAATALYKRIGHAMSYNPVSHRLSVYGGFSGTPLNDVWSASFSNIFCSVLMSATSCGRNPDCTWVNETCTTTPRSCRAQADCSTAMYNALTIHEGCATCLSQPGCDICQTSTISCISSSTSCTTRVTSMNQGICNSCGRHANCQECTTDGCVWSVDGQLCMDNAASSQFAVFVRDSGSCPVGCRTLNGCADCEADARCFWCESSMQCMEQVEHTSIGTYGQCLRYSGKTGSCPSNCTRSSSEDCFSQSRCGWCGFSRVNGSCVDGTLAGEGLWQSTDNPNCTVDIFSQPIPEMPFLPESRRRAQPPASWNYVYEPDIDECALGIAECSDVATCINEDPRFVIGSPGYRCDCPANYTLLEDSITCQANCNTYGCENGFCTEPDVCKCFIGWYGNNCTSDCGCNGQCYCDALDNRTACLRNTEGENCTECKNGFYGMPINNGSCVACNITCNGHSERCKRHPSDPGPVCLNCRDETRGEFCEQCNLGYFLDPQLQLEASSRDVDVLELITSNQDIVSTCVACDCNGHGSICDPISGELCQCEDNTQTQTADCDDDKYGSCWHAQCATCKPSVVFSGKTLTLTGNPEDSQRCYAVPAANTVLDAVIQDQEYQHFLLVPLFTNVHLDIALEQDLADTAELNITIATTSNASLTADGLQYPSSAIILFSGIMKNGRYRLVVRKDALDLNSNRFYVSVNNQGPEQARYQLQFIQPVIAINLFVFFSVFFSSFYLFLAALIVFAVFKSHQETERMVQQEQAQLQEMANRPMASIHVLLGPDELFGQAAKIIADLILTNQVSQTPISHQPLAGNTKQLDGYLIELPSDSSHRSLVLGTCLTFTEEGMKRHAASTGRNRRGNLRETRM